jgi:hypothetical protein
MKNPSRIMLFLFFIILVNCKKVEENKIPISNFNSKNNDTLIHSLDTTKIGTEKIISVKENWDGDYSIKTKAISNSEGHQEIDLGYYINIKSKKAILSISAEYTEDYWCEGDYYLQNIDNTLYATGKCDQNDENDFVLKDEKNFYFIKSKRFKNKDWQLLSKE